MSSTPLDASPAAAAPAGANFLAAAVIFVLFVLAAAIGAERKDIGQGFDEVAHVSYVADIQETGEWWPALESLRLLDPNTFEFTGEANYLNHPPIYYALLAAMGPRLVGHKPALLNLRLIDVAVAAGGFAVLLALGLAARLSRDEFYAYAVPLACIPVLAPLAGAVNNDDLAFLGGALVTLGAWQVLATGDRGWFAVLLAGIVAAGWAKFTGLLLTGAMAGAVVGYLLWRKRLPWSIALAALLVFALAAAPYAEFWLRYGSPAPDTPAQLALLQDGARAAGWADQPRLSPPSYAAYFMATFIAEWMPALGARSVFNEAMLIIPGVALLCAGAGLAVSLARLARGREAALDVVVLCGAAALALTFAAHLGYSYQRHLATGWLMDAYPRYYLPLAAIIPLAGLSLLKARHNPATRAALLGFLIAGPVVFRVFGAPLG